MGKFFLLGGTKEEFESKVCMDGRDVTYEYNNKGKEITEHIFPEAKDDMARADMLYYRGADLMMKIANYKPPVKEEDDI